MSQKSIYAIVDEMSSEELDRFIRENKFNHKPLPKEEAARKKKIDKIEEFKFEDLGMQCAAIQLCSEFYGQDETRALRDMLKGTASLPADIAVRVNHQYSMLRLVCIANLYNINQQMKQKLVQCFIELFKLNKGIDCTTTPYRIVPEGAKIVNRILFGLCDEFRNYLLDLINFE